MKNQKLYSNLLALAIYCGIASIGRANVTHPERLTHPNQADRIVFVDQSQLSVLEQLYGRKVTSQDLGRAEKYSQVIPSARRKGPGVGGGGYSYSRAGMVHLTTAIETISRNLEQLSDQEFHRLQQNQIAQIPLNKRAELISIIRKTRVTFLESVSKVGPAGQLEPLMMDYRTDPGTGEKYIVVLPILLQTYNRLEDRYLRLQDESPSAKEISRLLLHEASHLFGIGVKDDDESFAWAMAINESIFKMSNPGPLEKYLSSGGYFYLNLVALPNHRITVDSTFEELEGLMRSQRMKFLKLESGIGVVVDVSYNTRPMTGPNPVVDELNYLPDLPFLCDVLNERNILGKKWVKRQVSYYASKDPVCVSNE